MIEDKKEIRAKTTFTSVGTPAVCWTWRKKEFNTTLASTKRKMATSGWYALDMDGKMVTLAWRCPIILENGIPTFPKDSKPCTDKEMSDLDKAQARRSGIPEDKS